MLYSALARCMLAPVWSARLALASARCVACGRPPPTLPTGPRQVCRALAPAAVHPRGGANLWHRASQPPDGAVATHATRHTPPCAPPRNRFAATRRDVVCTGASRATRWRRARSSLAATRTCAHTACRSGEHRTIIRGMAGKLPFAWAWPHTRHGPARVRACGGVRTKAGKLPERGGAFWGKLVAAPANAVPAAGADVGRRVGRAVPRLGHGQQLCDRVRSSTSLRLSPPVPSPVACAGCRPSSFAAPRGVVVLVGRETRVCSKATHAHFEHAPLHR